MRALIFGLAALIALPAAAPARAWQEPPAAPAAPADDGEVSLRLPVVEGAASAPDCGGLYGLAERGVICMSTSLTNLSSLAGLYMAALPQAGWGHIGGGDNQVLFQHIRGDGLCDALIMIAFFDVTLPEEAVNTASGYLGFAMDAGVDCRAPEAPVEAPSQP